MLTRILLVMIVVLLMCSSAFAEGWVLWERNTELGSTSEWKIVVAFPKYEQCVERHNKDFATLKKIWSGFKIEMLSPETMVIEKYHPDAAFGDWVITQKCFPYTIDPRDKKE